MYLVYAIQSLVGHRLYVGISQSVERRLREHNSEQVFSTKGYCPWILVYSEAVGDRKDARKREKYFKSGSGKEYLKNLLKQKLPNNPG